jgi:hypothetical protein
MTNILTSPPRLRAELPANTARALGRVLTGICSRLAAVPILFGRALAMSYVDSYQPRGHDKHQASQQN